MMTREEMCEAIQRVGVLLDGLHPNNPTARSQAQVWRTIGTAQGMLANVLGALEAAPTCACGGRPSIWEGICSVNEVRGNKAYIDTVYITTYVSSVQLETGREALKAGDEVEVLAFLPAKEEAPQS